MFHIWHYTTALEFSRYNKIEFSQIGQGGDIGVVFILNISVKTYYNWIKEETDVPSTKLVMMAKMFGTNVDYLLQGMTGVPHDIKCLSERESEGR